VLLASSLDFLQGTFEKIHLQGLLGQQSLELTDLFAECGLARVLRRRFGAAVNRLQLIAPFVQQPPMNAQLLRQRYDVLATLQSLDRHSTELDRITSLSSLCHLQFLPLQSVPYPSVSSEGVSPELGNEAPVFLRNRSGPLELITPIAG
jgi:hypothetical protein